MSQSADVGVVSQSVHKRQLARMRRDHAAQLTEAHRSERQRRRRCFWTWPWGHLWVRRSMMSYCENCGKERVDGI